MAQQCDVSVEDGVLVDGVDASAAIRGPEVTAAVSAVAANPAVRARARPAAAGLGALPGHVAVAEGRDMGTVVFPDADVKVFLTASEEERARRRHAELPGSDLAEVREDLRRRDRLDTRRVHSPLRPADDATLVATDGRPVEDVVDEIGALVDRLRGAARHGDGARTAADRRRPTVELSSRTGAVRAPIRPGFWAGEGPAAVIFYKFAQTALKVAFTILFRTTVEGREHIPATGAFVLAPVHRSNLDTPMQSFMPRRLRFMGKDSLWKVGWAAWLLSALGGFPVNRGCGRPGGPRRRARLPAGR